jgi:hypothetical protein
VVSGLKSPELHYVSGVAGLALLGKTTGARSWILHATIGEVVSLQAKVS